MSESEQKPQQRVMQVDVSTQFYGPIPPPAILEGYNRVLPGSAERILKMDENEQANRGGLIVAGVGKQWGGLSAFVLSLAALVGVYLKDRTTHHLKNQASTPPPPR